MIGPVQTTHQKVGSRRSISSTQPPKSLEVVLETLRTLPQPAMTQDAERDETQHGSPHRPQNARIREGLAQTDEKTELQHLRCLVEELRSITVTVDGRKASATDPGGVG